MRCKVIDNIEVNISGDDISAEELAIYLNAVQAKYKYKIIQATVTVDGDHVDVNSTFDEHIPFERKDIPQYRFS